MNEAVADAVTVGMLWKVLVWAIGIIQMMLTAWGLYLTRSILILQREHLQFQLYVAKEYATKDEFLLSVTEINRKMDKLLSDFNALLLTR